MSPAPPAGSRVTLEGRFQLEQPLEGFGFGEAWRARDGNFRNRMVMVKYLAPKALDGASLNDTAAAVVKALRALRHPQVLSLVHSGVHQGRGFVVYEHFDGVPLGLRLDDAARGGRPLDLDLVERIIDLAAGGVSAGHDLPRPLLHRAVHPSSFVMRAGDGGTEVKTLDVALATFADDAVLESRRVWRCPEELRDPNAELTPASDVFALGLLSVELILGHDPSRREAARTLAAREGASYAVRLREDVPTAVWEVLDRALRHDPAQRFEHATALRDALRLAWRQRSAQQAQGDLRAHRPQNAPDLVNLAARPLAPLAPDAPVAQTPPAPPSSWGAGWEPAAPAASPWAPASPAPMAMPPLSNALPAVPSLGARELVGSSTGMRPSAVPWSPAPDPSGGDPWASASADWSAGATDNPWDSSAYGAASAVPAVPIGGVPSVPVVGGLPGGSHVVRRGHDAPREETRALDLEALGAAGLLDSLPGPSVPPPEAREATQALDLEGLGVDSLGDSTSVRAALFFDEEPATLAADATPPEGYTLDASGGLMTSETMRPSQLGFDPDDDWRDAVVVVDTAQRTSAPAAASMGHAPFDDDGSTSVKLGGPSPQGPGFGQAPRRMPTQKAPVVPTADVADIASTFKPARPMPRPPIDAIGATLKPMQRESVVPDELIRPQAPQRQPTMPPQRHAPQGFGQPLPPNDFMASLPPNDLMGSLPPHDPFGGPPTQAIVLPPEGPEAVVWGMPRPAPQPPLQPLPAPAARGSKLPWIVASLLLLAGLVGAFAVLR